MPITDKIKISIRSLSKTFDNNKVLSDINLDIKAGSSLVIIGPSSAGKSVLAKTIIGLIKPDNGSIIIDGIEITDLSTNKKLDLINNWGFLFQNGGLFDSLSVKDNITFLMSKLYNLSEKSKKEIAISQLNLVGLSEEILDFYPAELSGGMQKRVGIARAICHKPSLIFFDDPTGGLDPIMSAVITQLITKIHKEFGATIITITHNMVSAYRIAEELVLLNTGQILWHGNKEAIKDRKNHYIQQFVNGSVIGPIKLETD